MAGEGPFAETWLLHCSFPLMGTQWHHRNQTQTHTERAEHKAQGGKKDHRPRRGANVVKEAHMLRLGVAQATGLIGL